jgi:hypothetical protein
LNEIRILERSAGMKRITGVAITLLAMVFQVFAGEYAFVTSPAYMELVNTPRTAPADWREQSGAVFMNREWEKDPARKWYVETQRDGGRWVQAGLAHRNGESVEWGLKQLEWGFARMKEDGSFDCDDAFHSASFLVETTAHSILLIEASPMAGRFQTRVDALKKPLLKCALWMASPVNFRAAENQRIYGHRRFLVGCGLMQSALIHDHEELRRVALYFIQDGIRLQRQDGAFPEKGGHDSSYHAVALIYLQRLLLVTPEEFQQPSWHLAAQSGNAWLASRIDPQGVVSVKGNTRTGSGQEVGRTGTVKKVNRPEVAMALLYQRQLGGGESLENLASLVLTAPEVP